MKRYKKLALLTTAVMLMVMSVSACSEKKQTVTLMHEENGIETYMQFDAEGDNVYQITQYDSFNFEEFGMTEEEITEAAESTKSTYDETLASCEGTSYSYTIEDTVFTETFVFDTSTTEKVQAIAASGVLSFDSEATYISFDGSIEQLTENGWIKQ